MNLNEQARIWLNEGDYQKVLDAIDQTEPLSPELSLLEAEARNMRGEAWLKAGDVEDRMIRVASRETVEKLDHLWDTWEGCKENPNWFLQTGRALYLSDQPGNALNCLLRAKELGYDTPEVSRLAQECQEWISFPVFREKFPQRAAKAWKWFQEQEEPHILEMMARCESESLSWEERNSLEIDLWNEEDRFGGNLEDCTCQIEFDDSHPTLTFLLHGRPACMYIALYMKDFRPEELRDRWKLYGGIQRAEGISLTLGPVSVNWDDVQVQAEWLNGRVSLDLWCEKLTAFSRDSNQRESIEGILSYLLSAQIGEINEALYVDSVRYCWQPLIGESFPLSDLCRQMKQRVEMFHDVMDVYCADHPVLKRNAVLKNLLLADIYSESGLLDPFRTEFFGGDPHSQRILERNGMSAGFLYTPRPKNTMTNLKQLQNLYEKFVQSLHAVFFAGGRATNAYCLGVAVGLERLYYAIVAWDLEDALPKVAAAMERIPVENVYFHTFDPGAKSILVYRKKPSQQENWKGHGIRTVRKGSRKKKK